MAKKTVKVDNAKALEKAADEFLANLARATHTGNSWEKPEWGNRKVRLHYELMMNEREMEETLALLADGTVFETALKNFIKDELLGPEGVMYQMYHSKTTDQYLPQTVNSGLSMSSLDVEVAEKLNARTGGQRRTIDPSREALKQQEFERKSQGMYRGFADLWRALSVFSVSANDGVVTAGIGPRSSVESLRLSDYMRMQGSTASKHQEFNSLFYAVEYGTGIHADYNGEVRLDGPTKDEAEDGSWWLGRRAGQGLHFEGQQGFHFLYDERSRRPKDYIRQQVEQKFPQYVTDALKAARAATNT